MPSGKFTIEELGKLASMRMAGYSTEQIAERLDRTFHSVQAQINQRQIPSARSVTLKTGRWTSIEESTLIYYLKDCKLSITESATKLRRPRQHVQNKIQKLRKQGRL